MKRITILLLMAVLVLGCTMSVYAGNVEPTVLAEQESKGLEADISGENETEMVNSPISLEELDLDVSLTVDSFEMCGPSRILNTTVKAGQKTLIKGTDYKASFTDDLTKVILEGIGEYTGTVERTYKIIIDAPASGHGYSDYESVWLSWYNMEGVTAFIIYRADGTDEEYKKIGEVESDYASYIDDYNLLAGKTYYYKIQAYKVVGENITYGPYSEPIVIQHKLRAPDRLQVEADTYNSLKISWNSVDEADGYQVYYSNDPYAEYTLFGEYDSGTLSDVSKNLVCETMYYYKVRAYRWVDGERVFSSFRESSNKTYLTAPQGVTAESASYSTVKVSWEKEEIESYYQVYRATSEYGKYSLLGVYDKDTTSIISKSLRTGTTYYYKVRRYCMVNNRKVYSGFSEITSAAPLLSAPKGVTAKGASYSTVKVSWEKEAGVSYYQVYRATSKTGRYTLIGVYDKDTTSMTSKSLGAGITYYYKVKGYRWSGGERRYSSFSEVASATPVLSAPKGVSAVGTSSSTVKVSWSKTDGANYYQVYRAYSKNGKYSLLGVYDKNTTSMTSKSLRRGTTYYYKVRCYRWVKGQRVFSGWSTVVPATTNWW